MPEGAGQCSCDALVLLAGDILFEYVRTWSKLNEVIHGFLQAL
jgi:hypothetical protein